jgi:hypothetical protein
MFFGPSGFDVTITCLTTKGHYGYKGATFSLRDFKKLWLEFASRQDANVKLRHEIGNLKKAQVARQKRLDADPFYEHREGYHSAQIHVWIFKIVLVIMCILIFKSCADSTGGSNWNHTA